jgi:hypothetical protein
MAFKQVSSGFFNVVYASLYNIALLDHAYFAPLADAATSSKSHPASDSDENIMGSLSKCVALTYL